MESLPIELICELIDLNLFTPLFWVKLACTSKTMYEKVSGNSWQLAKLQSLNGLEWCCVRGSFKSVRFCLKDSSNDLREIGSRCLEIAAALDCPQILDLLLKDGRADPTSGSCMTQAILFNPTCVELLLQDGRVDIVQRNTTYFELAAQQQPDVLEMLLQDPRTTSSRIDHQFANFVFSSNLDSALVLLENNRFGLTFEKYFFLRDSIRHPKIVERLFDYPYFADLTITFVILNKAALENLDSFRILLEKPRSHRALICTFTYVATHVPDALQILLDWSGFQPTEEQMYFMICASANNKRSTKILLKDPRFSDFEKQFKKNQQIVKQLESL